MTILSVRHVTTYLYRKPVAFGEHRMMFRPRDSYDQRLIDRIRVDHYPSNLPDFQTDPQAKTYPFAYSPDEIPDLAPSIARGYPDQDGEIDRWVHKFLRPGRPTSTGRLLMTLTHSIKEGFTYTRRAEHGTQDPVVTVRIGRGSCRDFALLMIESVRSLGFAARFVSGYLHVPSCDGPEYVGGGSTHAWCQVYLPGAGWVEFDPTNGIIGNRDLIRVAVARDPAQAVPLSGTYVGDSEDELGMKVEVSVKCESDPRNRQ